MENADKQVLEMTPEEAWDDFYRVVYPTVKGTMEWHERNRVITANRDRHGKRKREDGTAYGLGAERIESILAQYAPGRYAVERRLVFRIVEGEG